MWTTVLIVLICIAVGFVSTDDEHLPPCTQAQVSNCISEFNRETRDLLRTYEHYLATFRTFEITALCKQESKFSVCMEILEDLCFVDKSLSLEELDTLGAIGEICDEDWTYHGHCLDQSYDERNGMIDQCLEGEGIKGVRIRGPLDDTTDLNTTHSFCDTYYTHEDCVFEAVKSTCGRETADFINDLFEAGFDDTLKHHGCHRNELLRYLKDNIWIPALVGLILIIVVIMAVVICICRCMARRRREAYKESNAVV